MIVNHILRDEIEIKRKTGTTTNGFIGDDTINILPTTKCYLEASSNQLKTDTEKISKVSHLAMFEYVSADIKSNDIAVINSKEYEIVLAEPVPSPFLFKFSHWELSLNEIK